MSTASTKSRDKSGKQVLGSRPGVVPVEAEVSPIEPSFFDNRKYWLVACLIVLVIAGFFRFYLININPLHHDEGVNGYFLTNLYRENRYEYDPANYHGPTLYYFALAEVKTAEFLFGKDAALTTFGIRLIPIAFGLATICLVFMLRRWLGAVAVLMAGLLIAISPGAVYMSRYFIHETLFTFFTLGIVVALLKFEETKDIFYLVAGSLSAGLLFATKETAIISVVVLFTALQCVWAYNWLFPGRLDPWSIYRRKKRRPLGFEVGELIENLGGFSRVLLYVLLALAIFLVVNVVFYSSFFTHMHGLVDSIRTFGYWFETGKTAHTKGPEQYFLWLLMEESALLILGAAGALYAVVNGRNRVALFVALWAFGILAAYSLIRYKTPWIAINFIVPLAVVSGYVLSEFWNLARESVSKVAVALMAFSAVIVGTYQMISINYYHYDDDSYAYVYAHTQREFLSMIAEIGRIAKVMPTGNETNIAVMAPEYWPLPWYLKKYPHVGYFGKVSNANEPIVIGEDKQDQEFSTNFSGKYRKIGTYILRPGVSLSLWVRRDMPF